MKYTIFSLKMYLVPTYLVIYFPNEITKIKIIFNKINIYIIRYNLNTDFNI